MVSARKAVEAQVVAALAEALAVDAAAIDPGGRFSQQGLTSLTAAAFTTRLSAALARELPATLVWDHPTPTLLAAFLCGESAAHRVDHVRRMPDDEPIAIVGMACRLPGATDPEAFWRNLVDGVDSVGEVPRDRLDADALYDPDPQKPGRFATRRGGFLDQVDRFDAAFFGLAPREAIEVDPQQRLVLELAWEALERAGIAPSRLHGSRTGVFMGAMWSEYGLVSGGLESIASHSATGRDTGVIANRVSYVLGLTGPSLTVNTACSSSLVAIHLACRSLRSGESTLALAGGVNLMLAPDGTVAMTKFGAMAPDGRSKAFDARANGYVRGEGAGVVLLKPLWRALADGDTVLALVRGSAVNNDGPSNGLTAPNPEAQRAVLRDACADARIDPAGIDYVEAHGTGTMLGDPIEAGALGAVLGMARAAGHPLVIGSAKTNVGHLEAAAGVTGLIKAVLALGHRSIPRSLHFVTPNPHIDFAALNVQVAGETMPWPESDRPPRAGVSSFGFGGTNAHVVLEAWDAAPVALPAAAVVPPLRQAVFVYPGNGAQWPGMGRDLLAAYPSFRAALEACDAAFRELGAEFGVLDEVVSPSEDSRLADTVVAQATMFSVQVALTRLLRAFGYAPAAVIGHSLGEVAAAHVAGALSLRDAARVVLHRSRLQAQAAGAGAMAVVDLAWEKMPALLDGHPDLALAGANAPGSSTVAGPAAAIAVLLRDLDARGIAAQRIRVDVAYHSPAMDPMCAPLAEALEPLAARPARIPFCSTVEARLLPGEALDAGYWVANLRQPVRFAQAMAALPDWVYVEISPHPILAQSIARCLEAKGRVGPVLATLSRDEAGGERLARLLAQLRAAGVAPTSAPDDRPLHLLTLSAKDAQALRELASRHAASLEEPLADACHTANAGRDAFAHRLAAVAPDCASMRALLAAFAAGETSPGLVHGILPGNRRPTVRLLSASAPPTLTGLDRLGDREDAFASNFGQALTAQFADWGIEIEAGEDPAPDGACAFAVDAGETIPLKVGDAWACLLDAVARLFVAGVAFDARAFDRGYARRRRLLPTYPFQRRRFWPRAATTRTAGAASHVVEWERIEPRPALPLPAELVASLPPAPAATELPAGLDRLAAAYAAAALREVGATGRDDESLAGRRYRAALRKLAETADDADPESLADALLSAFPSAQAEIALIRAAGRHLPRLLDDRAAAFDVLFPGGSMETLQALYERSPFALTMARWTRGAFASAVASVANARIVEIGAGTGGTTAHLLPALGPGGHYFFTDVSRAFLDRAQATHGAHPGFATALLDIESPPGLQGVAGGNDVAIAVNVLHATRDLRATLANVHGLLRRGGVLFLAEITGAPGWLDLVFGLLDGWWRFEDTALRPERALLAQADWRRLLAEAGFDDVGIVCDGDRQSLIVARAGPVRGRRLVLGSGALATAVNVGLARHGVEVELHELLPATGDWVETLVCDRAEPAVAACHALRALFADPRYGRIALVQGAPESLDAATTQAARGGFALSAGVADPARWGGALSVEGDANDAAVEVLLDRLQEDRLRVTRDGVWAARLRIASDTGGSGCAMRSDRTYLVSGGLGTLGLACARWLVGQGVRHLALVGRRPPNEAARAILVECEAMGARVDVHQADVADRAAMAGVFAAIARAGPPLAGVVHAAGADALDPETAFAAKLDGAKVLDALTRDLPLDAFLLFSSAAGTWGAAGKEAYAAANAALDALAAWRRRDGLPAFSAAWGRFSVRGLLSENEDAALAEMGLDAMAPEDAFALAWRLAAGPDASAVVARVDWPRFRAVCETRGPRPLLCALPSRPTVSGNVPAPVTPVREAAAAQSLSDEGMLEAVRRVVAEVLGHDDAEALPATQGLFDLGLDSLLAVRLRSRLEERFGRAVPTAVLFSHPTVRALADWLQEILPAAAPYRGVVAARPEAGSAIAVIGIGCRFPGGVDGPDAFERLLFDGVNAVGEVPADRWDWRRWMPESGNGAQAAPNRWGGFLAGVDRFDAGFFGIAPKEAAFMDPQQRLLLETAWEAVEHAGIAPATLAGSATGVFVGITGSDYAALARRDRTQGLEAQAIVGQPANAAAGRIAFTLGLTGPAFVVDTACSSSLVAIHLACRALRGGECTSALAGGVNLMLAPETSVILARAGMLSPTGQCRAFDAGADGFVRAEGCAMVLLKPLQAALDAGDTVLAVVRGSAVNHDGRASGFTVPNGRAQEAVMRAALDDAGLDADRVAYVEAHGTGTALGDPIEAHALAQVFGEHRATPLWIGSVKTNIGHAESAAGVAGFIKTVLALRRGRIPATLHYSRLNPHIPDDGKLAVVAAALPFPAIDGRRIAAVSAFGASGTNAHIVLEAAEATPAAPAMAATPTSPFRRTRHWLDWVTVDAEPVSKVVGAGERDGLYRIAWESRPLSRGTPAGVWRIAGAQAEANELAQEWGKLAIEAQVGDAGDAQACAGVLWIAPAAADDEAAASDCEELQRFVAGATAPVWIVTRAAQPAGTTTDIDSRAATLWGIGRALALREGARWGGLVDLPADRDWPRDARALAGFLAGEGDEDQAALRDGVAWVPRLDRMVGLPAQPAELRDDRSYLVTGGYGALGLALARHLAAHGARHIALVGRHPRVGLSEEFAGLGVKLYTIVADVADAKSMQAVAAQLDAGMPPVAAIFHAAGVNDPGCVEALRPKLGGARVLHELSRRWPLQAFVLFSSAASIWGDSTLPAYAAANSALDAFAHWRRSQGLPALAVNFSRLDVRGMLDDAGAARFDRLGLDAVSAEDAFVAMRALAESGDAQATVAAVRWDIFAPVHRGRRARPLLERVAPAEAAAQAPSVTLSAAALEARLQAMVAELLGVEDRADVDVRKGFFALGLDSFGVVDLRRRIERELGVALPSSALFDAPSIAALVGKLAGDRVPAPVASVSDPVPAAPREAPGTDAIAIVGTACRLPGGIDDLDGLERLLMDGLDAVGSAPPERAAAWEAIAAPYRRGGWLDDVARFDADFFGISPREAVQIDPQHRLLLELAWQALENAGWSPAALAGSRTGVFVGITGTEYADLARSLGRSDAHAVGGQFLNAAAGRLSHALGLRGPSLAVDTACSSSAMALHLACAALRSGECDEALAGGANLLLAPGTSAMLASAKMLSAQGRCAAFDASADGYVRAEGCALVVLKRLSRAVADGDRVLAVIRGSASNHDGASSGFTVPNGSAQQAVIEAALAAAGVRPAEVSYVEAHGTGTALGDPIEMHALDAVFGEGRQRPLLVGSVKSNIGHAEAAAGVAGLLKLLVALRRHHIPAHLHYAVRNPHIRVAPGRIEVAARGEPWEPPGGRRLAGLSSFGASGTNVHLVLEEAPAVTRPPAPDGPCVLALSARRGDDIAVLAQQALHAPEFARACRETTLARAGLPLRIAIVGDDASQVRERLVASGAARAGKPRIAFLFTGQGAQYAGMARGLYRAYPVFRDAIDRCQAAMRGRLPVPLATLLFDDTAELVATERVQPALFSVGYALAELWRSFGVRPEAVIGHSVGEIAAACVAGALPLDSAAALVAERARLMGALPPGGAMAAVLAPAADLQEFLAAAEGAVVIAARNAPANTVLSGPADALAAVLARISAAGMRSVPLPVSHAFHSPLLEPMLDELERFASSLPAVSAAFPVISNLDGAARTDFDAAYWRAQARQPVAFADGMATLEAMGCDTFIEMGPQPTLCGLGRSCIAGATWIASLERGADDARTIVDAAAAAWQAGAGIDWGRVLRAAPQDGAALPPYPFRRTRHWLDTAAPARAAQASLFAAGTVTPAFDGHVHARALGRADLPVLADSGGLVHAGLHLAFLSSARGGEAPGEPVALCDVQFERPLVLDAARELQLLRGADGSASLYGREPDGTWTRYLRARLEASPAGSTAARFDAVEVRERCPAQEDAGAFYAGLAARGFPVGPGLRRIERLWWREGESLADASGAAHDGEPFAFGMPAGLYEACAQVAATAMADRSHGYLLLGWERMLRSARAATADNWIHARVSSEDEGATLRAEIGLHDAHGHLLARIEGAVLRRVVRAGEEVVPGTAWVGSLMWREATRVAGTADVASGWRLLATDAAGEQDANLLAQARPDLFRDDGASLVVLAASPAGAEPRALAGIAAAVRSLPGPARVLLVTRGCWSPEAVAGALGEGGAGTWGLAQAILAERADLACRCVDLAPEADAVAPVLAEVADAGHETAVAWSGTRRFVARLAALPAPLAPEAPARLCVRKTGTLEGLQWQAIEPPVPAAGEVLVEVAAAAPGLRDALVAYGLLQSGDGLGADCAGIVRAVGPDVTAWRPNDAVIAYVPQGMGALCTHIALPARLLRPLPAHLGYAAAATIPLPYLTAWHALVERARLQRGETVLVHCAGSAVGLAAVAVARLVGARVVATASPGKHAALRSMGIEVIGDSRTVAFAQAARAATGGRGVDVALGAFDSAACAAVGQALAKDGRLLDLTRVGHDGGIDLDRLSSEEPARFDRLFDAVHEAVVAGRLPPLPHEVVARGETVAALRRLSLGTVIGRLCVAFTPEAPPQAQGTWLVTGANGGIGRALARHLAERGVAALVLVDRHAIDEELSAQLQATGVRLVAATLDVADEAAMQGLLSRVRAELPPVHAIVHAAGVVADAPLAELDEAHFARTFSAKVDGARVLDRLSRSLPLAVFVLFSSVVSLLPSARQGAYAAANAALAQLARRRRAQGLPATALHWGPWTIGIGDALGERARGAWQAWGVTPLAERSGLALFDRLAAQSRDVAVLDIDWARYGAQLDAVPAQLEGVLPPVAKRRSAPRTVARTEAASLAGIAAEALPARLAEVVAAATARVLRLGEDAAVDPARPFSEQGMDSLMASEFADELGAAIGSRLPGTLAYNHPTPAAVVAHLVKRLRGDDPATAGPAAAEVPAQATEGDALQRRVRESLARASKLLGERR